jgi:hypothetical protein
VPDELHPLWEVPLGLEAAGVERSMQLLEPWAQRNVPQERLRAGLCAVRACGEPTCAASTCCGGQDPEARHDQLPDAEAAFLAALHREAEEARRAVFGPVLEDAPQAGGATPGAGCRGRSSTGGCAGCHRCRSLASPQAEQELRPTQELQGPEGAGAGRGAMAAPPPAVRAR